MQTVIFVPARKNSTGIKDKNLINLNGKPLISYTLKMCKKFSKKYTVFISTDSKKIKNYSQKFGYRDEYLRPKKLSTSKSNIVDSIIHGIERLKQKKKLR